MSAQADPMQAYLDADYTIELGLREEKRGSWLDIHLVAETGEITIVSNDPQSEFFHQNLFQIFSKIIEEQAQIDEDHQRILPPSVDLSRFKPIVLRGEPLSHTIIRDRGSLDHDPLTGISFRA